MRTRAVLGDGAACVLTRWAEGLCESGKNGYIDEGDFFMDIPYSFFQGDKFLIGYIDGYPQYPTQGKNIEDLEKHLLEIHRWLRDDSLNSREQKGILRNVP